MLTKRLKVTSSAPKVPSGEKSAAAATIFIINASGIVRYGFSELLSRQPEFAVVGEAADLGECDEALRKLKPSIIITDYPLRVLSEFKAGWNLRVVAFVEYADSALAARIIRSGAAGCLLREQKAETLLEAVGQVARGELYVPPAIASEMLKGVGRKRSSLDPAVCLSTRQLVIYRLIGKGFSTKSIATKLNLSVKTVEAHRANIKKRLLFNKGAELNLSAYNYVHL
jgi:DNA-binding NarL/FixJ family response regulator